MEQEIKEQDISQIIQEPYKKYLRPTIWIMIFVIIAFVAGYLVWAKVDTNRDFLNTLPGKIVFLHRDEQFLNLYTIFANGKDKKFIYHNSDPVNSNCLNPVWSKDGSKIYFEAMKDGKWSTFSINSEGEDLRFIGYSENRSTPCSDCNTIDREGIFADKGNLYYRDADGRVVQVFHWKFYDEKFNSGAGHGYNFDAAWSPDRKYIIFSVSSLFGGSTYITNKEGTQMSKFTSGTDPDWIY